MKKMSKVLSFFLVASLIFSAMVNTPAVSAGVGGSFGKNIDKSAIPEMIVSGTAAPDLILDRPVVAHEDDLISSIEVYDDADNGDIQLFSTDDITPSEFNTIFAPGITNSISEQKLSLKSFANEEISSYNGELTLRFSDISLPGRNGLNLNIGRVYQTAQADFAAKKIMQAKNPNGVLESINAYDDSSYLNDRYNLGAGWSFNFPSVQISKDYIPYPSGDTYLYTIEEKIYYHTGSGDVYQADFSESALPSHLKRYYTDNAVFLQNDTSYSNEQATSYYSFKDPDNIVQYFADDGRLIGIRDKYGNTINFEHNMAKIVNRVPNGGFENGLDMWNTSSSGVTSIYTGRYDDSALRMNSSGFAFAASAAIEVEPDTWYSLSADVFPRYGVDGDVVIEVHLMDAAYNERFVNIITVPYDLAENTWSEVSGSFATASSTRYVYIAIVAEEGIGHLYFDNICVEKPKPLISKITDSIGREIIFDYQGRIENKNAPNDLILTIKKPNGDVAKTIIYDRKAVSFTIEMDDGTRRALHAWYLSSSNTEGVDGYPVRYYYGGVTPDAKEYEELAWKPGLIYNVSATIKPMMSIVQYKNHVSIYEYEKVRKGLGRFGYYDTLRVKARYSKYDSADGYTGELNRLDYSYGGYCGNNNVDNETGYPVANFIDPDDYSGDDIIFTSVSTAAFAENDELATIHTYKNSRLYSKEISSSKLYQSNKNYYHYNSTFKDSIAFIENVIRNYNDEVHTYAAMTYNDWGGLETETCLLEEDLFDNPSERAKYTITYTYHEIHKKVTSAQYYNDADGEPVTELWDYDSLGRLIKYTNAMGEETEYFYENSIYPGNITKTTMADPSNTHYVLGSQTAQTIYTYDQYNAFVASEARSYQGGTSITLYEYEYLFGNIEKQINPDNDWWAFEYDEKGRLLSEYSPIVQGDGYIFYFVTDYAYPGLFFDPSYTIDPTRVFDVVVKNEYVYNITSGTYSSKSASQYLYGSEGEGLLLRQFDFDRPAGDGYEPIITQYRYDNYTRLTEVIDDAGKST